MQNMERNMQNMERNMQNMVQNMHNMSGNIQNMTRNMQNMTRNMQKMQNMTINMKNMYTATSLCHTAMFSICGIWNTICRICYLICRICNKICKTICRICKKICKAFCSMQNSSLWRFCIFCIRMHSPLCWWAAPGPWECQPRGGGPSRSPALRLAEKPPRSVRSCCASGATRTILILRAKHQTRRYVMMCGTIWIVATTDIGVFTDIGWHVGPISCHMSRYWVFRVTRYRVMSD